MSLIVDHLYKQFKSKEVLTDINFEVGSTEIVGLLGPNGAGKSTLLNILSGTLHATKGKVIVEGLDTSIQRLEAKRLIGYLPESNPLYMEMFVWEYLEFCASVYNLEKNTGSIEEVIDICGLKNVKSSKIGVLSKGYKQRLGIAQAILHKPKILILDEPTSGLDPSQQEEMKALIKSLSKSTLIIFSTHILTEVEDLCDRILIIDKGQIVKDCAFFDHKADGKVSLQEVYQEITKFGI